MVLNNNTDTPNQSNNFEHGDETARPNAMIHNRNPRVEDWIVIPDVPLISGDSRVYGDILHRENGDGTAIPDPMRDQRAHGDIIIHRENVDRTAMPDGRPVYGLLPHRSKTDRDKYGDICVVGPPEVGKTALTISFLMNRFIEEYNPTIGDTYRKQVIVGNLPSYLLVVDTTGSKEYSPMMEEDAQRCQGFLLVFSLTDRESFEKVQDYIALIYKLKDSTSVPIIIAANKCDLASELQVSNEELEQLGKEFNINCFLTSAKDRYNVEECFIELSHEILWNPAIPIFRKKSTCSLM